MISAFPEGTRRLADLVRNADLDVRALSRPLKPCDLSVCRGTCCHDGVYLSGEEASVIRALAVSERNSLEKLGADLPEKVVVYGKFHDIASGPKTATLPAPMKDLIPDYPAHFAETNCVFLLKDSRCSLQALAMDQEIDPWFFKPFTCWIHPLSFTTDGEGNDILTLFDETSDPHRFADFDGFAPKTHCGKTCDTAEARPAYVVLKAELRRLGEIGGRDLLGEINQQIEAGQL